MKNLVIVVTVLIIAVLGIGIYISSQNQSPKSSSMVGNSDSMPKDHKMNTDESSRYVEYSKSIFDDNSGKRRVLFFYANWCPICRPADEEFRSSESKIPSDAVLIRVNYNDTDTDQEEKDLATRYGITYQHTFVQIDQNGNEIAKWNGGQLNELLASLK